MRPRSKLKVASLGVKGKILCFEPTGTSQYSLWHPEYVSRVLYHDKGTALFPQSVVGTVGVRRKTIKVVWQRKTVCIVIGNPYTELPIAHLCVGLVLKSEVCIREVEFIHIEISYRNLVILHCNIGKIFRASI